MPGCNLLTFRNHNGLSSERTGRRSTAPHVFRPKQFLRWIYEHHLSDLLQESHWITQHYHTLYVKEEALKFFFQDKIIWQNAYCEVTDGSKGV